MGSCATLWALEASAFERLRSSPSPLEGDAYEAAESLLAGWEHDPAIVIARWRDAADNALSRIATGEQRGIPSGLELSPLAPLLGLAGTRPPLPWWVQTLWPADANEVGLLAPEAVRAIRETVSAAGLLAKLAPALARLDAFLDRAANAGCWVLGVEGHS